MKVNLEHFVSLENIYLDIHSNIMYSEDIKNCLLLPEKVLLSNIYQDKMK